MQHNRITQAWDAVEQSVPQAGAFLAFPMSAGSAAWQLYQLAYEQAQAAARSARSALPAFSIN